MKPFSFNRTHYLLYTLISIFIVLSPVIINYFIDLGNPNNSSYITEILTKHFVKISASIIFITGLICIPVLFLNSFGRKIYLAFLGIIMYVPAGIDFMHVLLFKARTNSSSFYSIFSTDKDEALEFIFDYSNIQLIIGIFIIVVIPLLLYYIYTFLFSLTFKKITLVFYLIAYGITGFFVINRSEFNYFNEISAYKFYSSYIDYKDEIKTLNAPVSAQNALHISKLNFKGKETHIILIGESTGKYHMQLYGYNRATTPELEKIKDKLIVFKNVKSSSVHTIFSLKDILILKDSNDIFTSNTLLDLFNQAGYKTYWLSNQQILGKNQTLVSSIANRASKKIFLSPVSGNRYDGELIPHLDKLLQENEQKKVIFIHLMGTHLSYQNRYPNEFNRFQVSVPMGKDKNISFFGDHADCLINHYDNAILYNDYVVTEIIKRIDSFDGMNSIVYFSDHGEEVFDFRDFHGHSEALLSKYMYSVPFIVYCNKNFNEAKQEKVNGFGINIEKDFSLKNLSHTLQDLYDIESGYFDKSKSFFSKTGQISYNENVDSVVFYSSQPFPSLEEKIWVHRVNSIERLNLVQDKFKGMELDIVYENGKFDVRHPPTESGNLSLDDFFSNVKEIQKHYFWLDLKNLQTANQKAVINRLNYLTAKYPVKNNIIIETRAAELIPGLNAEGYCTSYYFPGMTNYNEIEIKEKLIEISENILQYKPNAISQNIDNYMLINQYFTNCNKLIWALDLDWNNSKNHERINNVLKNDSTIKICLIEYKTKGWK